MQSDYEHVCEFTSGTGHPIPSKPQKMNKDEVSFLAKMVLDETMELLATVYSSEEAKEFVTKTVMESRDLEQIRGSDNEIIVEQADAMVDIYYYCLNAASKKGMDISTIFHIVHEANMNKRDPQTGKFIKNEEGKIIKPKGWTAPDVLSEINRQMGD